MKKCTPVRLLSARFWPIAAAFSLLLCFSLVPSSLFATAHGGTIRGLVVDAETNSELPGAFVRLLELDQTAISNELGMFTFGDLPGGKYTLVVSFIGFETSTQTMQVVDHESVAIKFTLKTAALDLADVQVNAQRNKPLQTLSALDLQTRPLNSAQDVLRFVPGVVIAQHAGGGKAEQIFLRGFDIDHGTDIALFADGLPVNMVSHAHGQGYADLHFVIPEMIETVDFQKGTYDARVGNFSTAGYVKFETPDVLRQNFLKMEAGQYDHYRTVAAIDLLGQRAASRGTSAYLAAETLFDNGYFDAPQNFKRINLFGKFRQALDERQTLVVSLSRFTSSWLASGQIPERAVASGQIGRFGAIDPTEGGATGRQNLNVQHWLAVSDKVLLRNQFYVSKYDFELYSNFTFFLNDPLNGDQIRQKESRTITGYNGAMQYLTSIGGKKLTLETGANLRYDETADSELSATKNRRETLSRLALGDIQELNFAPYADANLELSKRLTLNAGLRFDVFHYSYVNKLDSAFTNKTAAKTRPSPKLNLHYQATPNLQFFALSGVSFHSNDTRTILEKAEENILPGAFGVEAGAMFKPFSKLLISLSAWQLDLQQEFVYVGDAGVVEPSGRSLRRGIDLSARWQIASWLFLDADYNFTRPRATEEPEGADYIPLAPTQTSIGGLTVSKNGFSGSLRYRYLADRSANEDNSLTAEGFFLLDAQLAFAPKMKVGKRPLEFSLSALNLTNSAWKEAQFETESRLRNEAEPVTEIHYTPGTPVFVKGAMTYRF